MSELDEAYTPVTVNLTPHAIEALDYLYECTGETQTDTINQAIRVYAQATELIERARNTQQPSGLIGRIRAWVRQTPKPQLWLLSFVFGGVGYSLTTLALMLTFGG